MSESSSLPSFAKLSESNYDSWHWDMMMFLKTRKLWSHVDGSDPQPAPADKAKPTADELKELRAWKQCVEAAAGYIWYALDANQKTHVKPFIEDPGKMWTTLKDLHQQQTSASRFNAYEDFFNIVKRDDESLSALITRVEESLMRVKQLRPDSFTLANMDDELGAMALIRALPSESYGSFRSSLLLQPTITMQTLKSAFVAEENNRKPRA
ncbi:hypothetical protein BOTBODRAFT_122088, partial [Botryobasidium botryosum FD-172 SS1]